MVAGIHMHPVESWVASDILWMHVRSETAVLRVSALCSAVRQHPPVEF